MLTSHILTFTALGMTALAAPATIAVRTDDVVLYGKGRYQIMKRTDLEELEAYRKNGTVPPRPSYLDENLNTITAPSDINAAGKSARSVQKRAESTIIVPGPDSRFLGWDVLMSQVAKGAPTTVSVSTGYSIANSVTVGASADFTLVKDFLSTSMSIDYGQTWTSTQTQLFSGVVPEGKYGAFVSNPWTNRKTGNVFQGTVGSEGSLSSYQADSFDSKAFADMQWVDGVISLCIGDAFPLPRCLGEGTL